MSDLAVMPDIDSALLDLAAMFGLPGVDAANIRGKAPTPGSSILPAVQIYTYDGRADQLGGEAIFDVHCFATTYPAASLLARTFDAKIMQYPHRVGGNGSTVLLDVVENLSIPTEVSWVEDNSVRRFQATYSVSFRR